MAKKKEQSRKKQINQLMMDCERFYDEWNVLYEHGGRDPT